MRSASGQQAPAKHCRRPITGRLAAAAAVFVVGSLLQACGSTDAAQSYSGAGYRSPAYTSAYNRAPAARSQYDIVGVASWYGKPYHGRRTASGEVFNMYAMTAAHPSLPFGTRVVVTNLENGRSAVVTINDRGPFVGGRVIDVSRKAAGQLGFLGQGLTRVGVRVIASSQG